MSTRADVVNRARQYLGTPWYHRGRQHGLAVDCGGLIICVGRDLGLFPAGFDVPEYGMNPDGHTLIEWCERYLVRISQDRMAAGDVIVVITDEYPQHMGILADYRYGGFSVIHSSNARSLRPPRVIEMRLVFSRTLRFVGAFSYPGIE